ncbi:hypothetical protein MKW98_023626, partial [Papaver atlanticum]
GCLAILVVQWLNPLVPTAKEPAYWWFLVNSSQRGLTGRIAGGIKSSFRYAGSDENTSIEVRYPAVLFKQQLAACVEKIFGMIRDLSKKEMGHFLTLQPGTKSCARKCCEII